MSRSLANFYTESDFDFSGNFHDIRHLVVRRANEKLEKYVLEHGLPVYAMMENKFSFVEFWDPKRGDYHTYMGRILFIEKIPKDCKHEPYGWKNISDEGLHFDTKCFHCGVPLQPTGWKVK